MASTRTAIKEYRSNNGSKPSQSATQTAVGLFVAHTHWDREWRYPIWKNRVLLVEFMDKLLGMLESDPAFSSFVLDGQCVVIEDYLQVVPQDEPRIRALVEAGRLKIGPWYTLPDLYPIDGECLLRNLTRGLRVASQLGGYMHAGYHSFGWGQTVQFPQIYRNLGFDFLVAAKRVSEQRAPHCEFLWRSPDGSQILTTRLGGEARANGFFNVYLPVRHGKAFSDPDYRFEWGKTGAVYHEAGEAECHKDYFRNDQTQGIHPEQIEQAMQAAWEAMDETLAPDFRLIMCGSDFTTPQPILTGLLKQANGLFKDKTFRIGSLEEYARHLHEHLEMTSVPVVEGELRDGPACNVSANALATRIPIKQLNKKAENALLRRAEPAASLLTLMGEEYPQTLFETAWKYLLQAHPHDSINGVTQDKSAHDTMYRIEQALEIGQVTYEQAMARLVARIRFAPFQPSDQLLFFFNPLPYPVREVVKVCVDTPQEDNVWSLGLEDEKGKRHAVQFVSRREVTSPVNDLEARPWPLYSDRHMIYCDPGQIPAGGYKVLRVRATEHFDRKGEWWPQMRRSNGQEIARTATSLENEYLKVDVRPDGSLDLTDKVNGQRFEGMHYFEETGDCGDYWAYYPPYNNQTFTTRQAPCRAWLEDNGPLSATIAIEWKMEVPAFAHYDQIPVKADSKRASQNVIMTITSRVSLALGSRRLEIKTTIDNTAQDHRVRVLLPTGIKTDAADAAGHFNVDRRPVIPLRDKEGQFYPEMQTAPQQIFVDVSDGRHGLAVVNDSLTEYQLMDDPQHTLALTLFRAMRNRICTEARSTGAFPDQKGGQLLGPLEFHYAIYPHAGDWQQGEVYTQARSLNCPPTVWQVSAHAGGELPLAASLLELDNSHIIISALKKAQDSDSLIVRLYNPGAQTQSGRLRCFKPIVQAHLTDINEQRESSLHVQDDGCLQLTLEHHKIQTVELVFTKES